VKVGGVVDIWVSFCQVSELIVLIEILECVVSFVAFSIQLEIPMLDSVTESIVLDIESFEVIEIKESCL